MCGHVGVAGKLDFGDEARMKRMLVLDFFRGMDSTGFMALHYDGPQIAKLASHPIDLFDSKKFVDALKYNMSTVFLGHNRAATRGKVNGLNAHPFEYGHICGAHNGTLDHSSWKALNTLLGYETDVDSQAIFACIEKFGIDETMKHMQGAWALVWTDSKEGTLNFLRNKERPLWYAYSKTFDKLMWASEWPMIAAANDLATMSTELHVAEGFRYWSFEVDWHYRFDIAELKKGSEDPLKPKVKILKGKEPAPVSNVAAAGSNPFHHYHGGRGYGQTHSTTNRGGATTQTTPEVINMDVSPTDPYGGILTKEEFDKLVRFGCSFCHDDIEYGDQGITVYARNDQVLCSGCSRGTNTRIYLTDTQMRLHQK